MYLGDTITTRYRASDEHFYQSYLIHNERGVLAGSVSLQSQRIGSVNTIELWLVERNDDGTDVETPLVTFVTQAAYEDTVFRARLSDRQLVPAMPGQRTLLETANLSLDARVRSVEPDPESDTLSLAALTLSLTADRVARAGSSPPEADPPIPLPFRAE